MAFEPALPGSWGRTRRDFVTSTHESAHGVLSILMKIPLDEIRIDAAWDGLGNAGVTRTGILLTENGLRRHLVATLAGPIAVGRRVPWPPDRTDDGDEGACGILIYLLEMDEAEWHRIVALTRELLNLPSTRRAIRAVSGALLERGALSGEEVTRMVREAGASSRAPARSGLPLVTSRAGAAPAA